MLELGALMRVYGVLDGELVQPELARDVGELLVRRPVQADPRDAAPGAARRRHLGDVLVLLRPLPVAIDRATDDHASKIYARGTARAGR